MECSIEIKRMDNEDLKLKKYYFKINTIIFYIYTNILYYKINFNYFIILLILTIFH